MKSSYALAALVGFALVNTAFLGVYLFSSGGLVGGLGTQGSLSAASTETTVTQTVTSTGTETSFAPSSTATVTTQSAVSSTSGVNYTISGGTVPATSTTTTQSSTLGDQVSQGASFGAAVSVGVPANSRSALVSLFSFLEVHSIALAPGSWAAVGGMWIWRGKMRSRWRDFGFDSDVFGLFVKMKGGKTRIRLLDALSLPKDRLQLAQELGLDWKGVDRHLVLMKKYGFVDDRVAYGKVRMYELTPLGTSLLNLLQELSREERREESRSGRPSEN